MNRNHDWRSSLLALTSAMSSARPALAQDHTSAEALEPAPMAQGSILSVYGARELRAEGYSLTVLGSHGNKPLRGVELRIERRAQ